MGRTGRRLDSARDSPRWRNVRKIARPTDPIQASRRCSIVGCGDVGLRVARLLRRPLARRRADDEPGARAGLRAAGVVPLLGDLDRPATLARLADLADAVLHLAPPAAEGTRDLRTAHLVRALARSTRLRRLVYGSTTGVYGDCAGALVDETRALRPASDRARRRVDAEARAAPSRPRRRHRRDRPAHPRHLRARPRRRRPARARCAAARRCCAAGRRVHQPHPRRRPRARLRRRAASRRAAARGPRRRRHPDEDGRLLRPRRRPVSAWRDRRACRAPRPRPFWRRCR